DRIAPPIAGSADPRTGRSAPPSRRAPSPRPARPRSTDRASPDAWLPHADRLAARDYCRKDAPQCPGRPGSTRTTSRPDRRRRSGFAGQSCAVLGKSDMTVGGTATIYVIASQRNGRPEVAPMTSSAKQSRNGAEAGLLRRFAPRNDGWAFLTEQAGK